jgi:hypothetical protein
MVSSDTGIGPGRLDLWFRCPARAEPSEESVPVGIGFNLEPGKRGNIPWKKERLTK